MQHTLLFRTDSHNQLVDITSEVANVVSKSAIETGMVNLYVQGATAGIMIQENWDESVQSDVLNWLKKMIPHGVWQHDTQDSNGDSHLKAGFVGPSETIPVINGEMGLSRWQNIFLCEFDGPRSERRVVVTIFNTEKT
ncbi:secondary thiamine-phosphate synthase enzyme YjbQ [Marinilabilia sp.]|uniref:secondary thiamine-phosphate synthase enzyme YjbQ n=1 Tax=Marinilabilia sp. TaxID=2021252 RepID=UPI0025B90C02|nr:secondary thiamine-phosphate synthase enzyme YjbQ [Marinilabilia sp.]